LRRERAEIRRKVAELSRKREDYLSKEAARSGSGDGFDAKVLEALREQAKEKGILY